jgi:3-hydroxyisobutyrate dehydrogenase-like beta-hydroxyacid dehydrogenase
MMPRMRVGVVGLGIMGAPMARNCLRAGHAVTVHTRTRARAEPLLAEGAVWADDAAAVAREADVVVTCLPDGPDVERS